MSNELAIIQNLTPAMFARAKEGEESAIDKLLKDTKEKVANFQGDISTEAGRKEIASFGRTISSSKVAVDDMGKKITEDVKAKVALVDGDRKKIRDGFDLLRDQVLQPLVEFRNADKVRVAKHEADIEKIIAFGTDCLYNWLTMDFAKIQFSYEQVHGFTDKPWEEFANRAALAISNSKNNIDDAAERRKTHEKEQAELEQLRADREKQLVKEREDKIKREAAETARLAAERVAMQEKLAAQKAAAEEKARIEFEKKAAEDAKEEAERRVREVEDKRVADAEKARREKIEAAEAAKKREVEALEKSKRDRQEVADRLQKQADDQKKKDAAEIAAREADVAHKRMVDGRIVQALLDIGLGNVVAETVVERMASGSIPSVKINY